MVTPQGKTIQRPSISFILTFSSVDLTGDIAMPTLIDSDLRAHIRRKLEAGELPVRRGNPKLFGSLGADEICDCCGRPVGACDVLYEVESPEHSPLAMHLPCFDAWQIESQGILDRDNSLKRRATEPATRHHRLPALDQYRSPRSDGPALVDVSPRRSGA